MAILCTFHSTFTIVSLLPTRSLLVFIKPVYFLSATLVILLLPDWVPAPLIVKNPTYLDFRLISVTFYRIVY